jgi:biopolymer transport protein ExbD
VSRAAIVLALAPGVAAWALRTAIDFESLVVLGTVGLLGGIVALGQPLPRGLRIGVAGFAGLTLLGTTGLEMRAMAAIRPFSAYRELSQKDLVELVRPVASEGESFFDPPHYGRSRVTLTIDAWGGLVWRQRSLCMDEIEEVLDRYPDRSVLLDMDQDLPYQFLAWLGGVAARHGHREVLLVVERFARSSEEARDLDAEYSREYWPALAFPIPVAVADGPVLRIAAAGWRDGLWPPLRPWGVTDELPRTTQRVATRARYLWDGRETEDLRELALWIRSTPPGRIEPDPKVPVKYVVAVENEIRKAGHPPAAVVLPASLPKAVRKAKFLPYPLPD